MSRSDETTNLADEKASTARQHVAEAPLAQMRALEQQEVAGGHPRETVLAQIAKRRAAAAGGGGEPTYNVTELATYVYARDRWHTLPSIVQAAFAEAGVADVTLEEADALVAEFRDRPAPHPNEEA